MELKEKYKWMKHIDFILIDLFCLIFSFILAYYLKFDNWNFFDDPKWSSLFVVICLMNLIIMFFTNPYSGILKRRYYLQSRREITLFAYQVLSICFLFYVLRIGMNFSREMMLTMYAMYFVTSQPIKYIHKKIITKEIFWRRKNNIVENKDYTELVCIDNRTRLQILLSKFLKRSIDICAGVVGCIILVPLTIIVFILNRINGEDGPVFYIQDRIGKDGRMFKMFKFRTMSIDADEKLERFLEENEDIRKEFYIYRKIKNDPRVTKLGKILRKTSLDEFPQFINLLMGDMSLVGPRPYLEREKSDMKTYYDIIIQDKPGITGLWQTSGRSDVTFEDRLRLDFEYHTSQSIANDIKILFKTVDNVVNKKGAI